MKEQTKKGGEGGGERGTEYISQMYCFLVIGGEKERKNIAICRVLVASFALYIILNLGNQSLGN